MFQDFDVIHSYTQKEAIEDGMVVDLSALFPDEIRECGILIPLYCTRSVYENYINLTSAAKKAMNDEKGRVWDLLFMARPALKAAARTRKEYVFKFLCVVKRVRPSLCTCKVVCDGLSFTILEIDED